MRVPFLVKKFTIVSLFQRKPSIVIKKFLCLFIVSFVFKIQVTIILVQFRDKLLKENLKGIGKSNAHYSILLFRQVKVMKQDLLEVFSYPSIILKIN